MPMNPEVKAQWGAWLLEHEGDQGPSALRRETEQGSKFCCLGGLCELAVAAGVTASRHEEGASYFSYGADAETAVLPPEVREWAGLAHANPVVLIPGDYDGPFTTPGARVTVAELNDRGMPFREVWQLIDREL